MKKVNVLFGTVYGTAQNVAEVMVTKLESLGYQAQLWQEAELENYIPSQDEYLLLVSSTTGRGDLPDDIAPWFSKLKSQSPFLPKLNYAVVALGDSSYENFCGAGLQLNALLDDIGAHAVLPMLKIDAMETTEPEQCALDWLQEWHEAITTDAV